MSKEDTSRSVHQRLLNIRDTTGEQFNHLLMRYGLDLVTVLAGLKKRLWPLLSAARHR